MKERGILFSGPLVRAILEGRKTQTRRLVKPSEHLQEFPFWRIRKGVDVWIAEEDRDDLPRYQEYIKCPYGKPGDRLWVRETHYVDHADYADGGKLPDVPTDEILNSLYYRADGECCQQIPECQCDEVGKPKWRPSLLMKRWASRIDLEITAVRVERLLQINTRDAIREGMQRMGSDGEYWAGAPHKVKGTPRAMITAQAAFVDWWDHIYGEDSVKANPYVWVIEFKKL